MGSEVKNQLVEQYIENVINSLNQRNIRISDEEKKYIIDRYFNSDKSIEVIKEEINDLVQKFVKGYLSENNKNENQFDQNNGYQNDQNNLMQNQSETNQYVLNKPKELVRTKKDINNTNNENKSSGFVNAAIIFSVISFIVGLGIGVALVAVNITK